VTHTRAQRVVRKILELHTHSPVQFVYGHDDGQRANEWSLTSIRRNEVAPNSLTVNNQ
jgi:hypothetical protein